MSKEDFIEIVTADQPEAPDYFTYDAVPNTKEHPTLERSLESGLHPLSLDDVLQHQGRGGVILDMREPAEFEGAHLTGSLNIGLDGPYATWAGTLLSPEETVVIVAEPGREVEAATRLGRIGFDKIGGYMEGGMAALEPRQDLVSRTSRVTAGNLRERLEQDDTPVVVDVTTHQEWEEEHIE